MFRWHLGDGSDTNVILALPTTAPKPESVQLEGWDGVWGNENVPYWDPARVDEQDLMHHLLPYSLQDYSVLRDVKVWKEQNYKAVPLIEEALFGEDATGAVDSRVQTKTILR